MLLRIADLHTHIRTHDGVISAVDGVSLSVPRGKTVALVGESGCGKSITSLSILRLLPPGGFIARGRIEFDGVDLVTQSEAQMRRLRGNRIAMIFQEPMSCLNPVLSVGAQLCEPLRLHRRMSMGAAQAAAAELLRSVGIPAPESRLHEYPHRLSGGMRQRVMIAMALACEPALLIADEPTTALDVTVQAQILDLLRTLQARTGTAILFITHDLGVVAQIADDVAIMYAGRIVETAPVVELFDSPRHPYTRALLRCLPRLEPVAAPIGEPVQSGCAPVANGQRVRAKLPVIAGDVPTPARRPSGCAFHPRCDLDPDNRCRIDAPPLVAANQRSCACWKS